MCIRDRVSVAQWCISPRLNDFAQKNPNIRIRLLSAVWPDDFQKSQADVEIRFGTAAQAGTDAISLGPNRLIAVKSPRLEAGLTDLPLIETVGTSTGWNAWQKKYGALSKPVLFADTYGLALQLATDGNGVTLISEFLAAKALRTGTLEQISDGFIEAKEGYYLSFSEKADGASTFADWIKECMAD